MIDRPTLYGYISTVMSTTVERRHTETYDEIYMDTQARCCVERRLTETYDEVYMDTYA
jgi:hypothetical protein